MHEFSPVLRTSLPKASERAQPGTLRLDDRSIAAKWVVHAGVGVGADALHGVTVGIAAHVGDAIVSGVSPGLWTILGPPRPEPPIWLDRAVGAGMAVVDVTHARALMRVTGADALRVMEKLCAIDFDDRFTPSGAAARTTVAAVATELVRDDVEGEPSYLLHCGRSFAGFIFEAIVGAGAEFGIRFVCWDGGRI